MSNRTHTCPHSAPGSLVTKLPNLPWRCSPFSRLSQFNLKLLFNTNYTSHSSFYRLIRREATMIYMSDDRSQYSQQASVDRSGDDRSSFLRSSNREMKSLTYSGGAGIKVTWDDSCENKAKYKQTYCQNEFKARYGYNASLW
jgi:hypothetical protein